MQRVVDAPAFDHQEEAARVLRQDVDRLDRHLRQARLQRRVAVEFVRHVALCRREVVQTDQLRAGHDRRSVERGEVVDVGVALGLQFGHQVAPVGPATRRGRRVVGAPVLAHAAHQHGQAAAESGVVAGAAGHGLARDLVLGVAVAHVGVGGGRRGVRKARGRDRTGGFAFGDREFEQRRRGHAVAARRAVVDRVRHLGGRVGGGRHGDRAAVEAEGFIAGFHAGHVGGHRRCAVGRLGVFREGLDARGVGQLVHRKRAALADVLDARGRGRDRAHAVAEEEDHVLRFSGGVAGGCEDRAAKAGADRECECAVLDHGCAPVSPGFKGRRPGGSA